MGNIIFIHLINFFLNGAILVIYYMSPKLPLSWILLHLDNRIHYDSSDNIIVFSASDIICEYKTIKFDVGTRRWLT